jgi:ribulose-phosphate 3-epimerase
MPRFFRVRTASMPKVEAFLPMAPLMLKVAPSILSADFGRLAAEVKAIEDAGADYVHVDVMDGRFVPNITIGPVVIKDVKKATTLPLDCHLMIVEPERYIEDFAKAGADSITVHQEACPHLHRTIQQIHAAGARAGVSLNPSTPVSTLEQVIHMVDLVLIMTVNPGFGGQSFIPECVPKITQVVELAKRHRSADAPPLEVEVDGGINAETARIVERAGATMAVAGSAVYNTNDYAAAIRGIRGSQKRLVAES